MHSTTESGSSGQEAEGGEGPRDSAGLPRPLDLERRRRSLETSATRARGGSGAVRPLPGHLHLAVRGRRSVAVDGGADRGEEVVPVSRRGGGLAAWTTPARFSFEALRFLRAVMRRCANRPVILVDYGSLVTTGPSSAWVWSTARRPSGNGRSRGHRLGDWYRHRRGDIVGLYRVRHLQTRREHRRCSRLVLRHLGLSVAVRTPAARGRAERFRLKAETSAPCGRKGEGCPARSERG